MRGCSEAPGAEVLALLTGAAGLAAPAPAAPTQHPLSPLTLRSGWKNCSCAMISATSWLWGMVLRNFMMRTAQASMECERSSSTCKRAGWAAWVECACARVCEAAWAHGA